VALATLRVGRRAKHQSGCKGKEKKKKGEKKARSTGVPLAGLAVLSLTLSIAQVLGEGKRKGGTGGPVEPAVCSLCICCEKKRKRERQEARPDSRRRLDIRQPSPPRKRNGGEEGGKKKQQHSRPKLAIFRASQKKRGEDGWPAPLCPHTSASSGGRKKRGEEEGEKVVCTVMPQGLDPLPHVILSSSEKKKKEGKKKRKGKPSPEILRIPLLANTFHRGLVGKKKEKKSRSTANLARAVLLAVAESVSLWRLL